MQSVNGTSPNNPGREKKDAIDVETPESEAGGACGLHKKHEREREKKKEKERKTSKRGSSSSSGCPRIASTSNGIALSQCLSQKCTS